MRWPSPTARIRSLVWMTCALFWLCGQAGAATRIELTGSISRPESAAVPNGRYEVYSHIWNLEDPPRLVWLSQDTLIATDGRYRLTIRVTGSAAEAVETPLDLTLSFCPKDSVAISHRLDRGLGTLIRRTAVIDIVTDATVCDIFESKLLITRSGETAPVECRFLDFSSDSIRVQGAATEAELGLAIADIQRFDYAYDVKDNGVSQGAVGFLAGAVFGAGLGYSLGQSDSRSGDVGRIARGGALGGIVGGLLGLTRGKSRQTYKWETMSLAELRRALDCKATDD